MFTHFLTLLEVTLENPIWFRPISMWKNDYVMAAVMIQEIIALKVKQYFLSIIAQH